MIIEAPISIGELVDKITILRIKSKNITDKEKLINVEKEMNELMSVYESLDIPDIDSEFKELESVNTMLWNIEDDIRVKEKDKEFDDDFIQLARYVYFTNDKRADIKKQINVKCGSELVEEKSYTEY